MNRRAVVRFQLLILAILVVVLVGRRSWTSSALGEGIAITSVGPFELHRVTFRVDAPTRVAVSSSGSLQHRAPDAPLAAFGWLIRHSDYEPVWSLADAQYERRRGTHVRAHEELDLDPGTYDAYFTSYGNEISATGGIGFFRRFFREASDWERDKRRWELRVEPLAGTVALHRIDESIPADSAGIVWHSAPMGSGSSERRVFEVTAPLEVRVRAIGELSDNGHDAGWIDDLTRRRRVWEMSSENTEPAGGHYSNRLFDGTIRLDPGVYAASFETDPSHAPDRWRANPPYNPRGWGIDIRTDPGQLNLVRSFNPWETRTPLIALSRVGSSQQERISFTVGEPLDVVIDALGELTSTAQYDYGWIETMSGDRIWEMRYSNTGFAGGHSTNREALEILRLDPGTYVASFRTDDSHAYGDWRKGKPRQPERWGMTLFPLEVEISEDALTVVDRTTSVPDAPEPPPGVAHRPQLPGLPQLPDLSKIEDLGRHLAVQIHQVGNGANLQEQFDLEESRRIVVVATGELLPNDRYDYAWIERADNGETVWSMTWENTHPAGGDDRNRRFAGTVDLPAGEYVVRYRSDPSHAFGDFSGMPPSDPENWGVTVVVPPRF